MSMTFWKNDGGKFKPAIQRGALMGSRKAAYKASVLVIEESGPDAGLDSAELKSLNYLVETADSIGDARILLEEERFHLIVLRSDSPDKNAVDGLREKAPLSKIVVMAPGADIVSAVEGNLHPGADGHNGADDFYGIIGKSPGMKKIFSMVDKIAASSATVLIHGESGTGKRVIAHAIHKADKGPRGKGPFIEISCGALPREIIESELFGHTKGAFTGAINDHKGRFEQADKGTILLDDIDTLSLDLQVKLLRVLQQKEFERVGDHKTVKVDARIIATTNNDLKKLVAEKKFREDLYYRLFVISLDSPPLRGRKEDLPLLVTHFLGVYSGENRKKINGVSDEAMSVLMEYNWPGNIRQLENVMERAVIMDSDGEITKEDLPEELSQKASGPLVPERDASSEEPGALKDFLKQPEKVYILNVLKEVGWNKKKAACKLGVNRTTLYNKIRKYNIVNATD
ncbi:MAG: sigma-54-dependent Fis family transcriptional regulator [Candidatus Omnitrophica bacterium]|nr:sigma-54-dependent Fis family transcriptional regulator [Candidatus Omnitrophota bacterium]